jgi:phenylacetate-CoA ligase
MSRVRYFCTREITLCYSGSMDVLRLEHLAAIRNVDPEAIYLRLPRILQHLGCSLVGWRTERTRYAGAFPEILLEAQLRTYWSVEETRTFRDYRLAEFAARIQRSPLHRERLRLVGIGPSDIKELADLSKLPILTKEEAQQSCAEAVSTVRKGSRIVHTSGTTGGALRFPVTMRAIQEQWAIWWRYRGWHGIRRGTWCALLAGRSVVPPRQEEAPFWRLNYPGRQILFSGYHMSPKNLPTYVNELRRRRPPWIHGYPSLLSLLAAHMVEAGQDLGYDVKWVTIGAENLFPHQVAVIEQALGVKPLQHYGLAEGVANVSQCELGALHVDEDYAAVEFIPLGRDRLHRIIGTNFTNPATPFIRYDTQDLAIIGEEASCSCGRPGRVVERIDGRREDYVVLRDGTRLGRMDHIFKDMVNIHEAQIHQAQQGEMTIRVVRGKAYRDEDEQRLLHETVKRVGKDMDVSVEYVDALPRSSVGKLRFVVSELPQASIARPPGASS